jgi:alpha-ketoglutarate-dependent 2,4-dichlorophenoxyacetate dioxygenase
MPLTFEKLHPHFAAEVGPIDLRRVHDPETLADIRAGMDAYAVLVFRDQPFADEEQIAFAQRLDGELHTKTGSAALKKSRLGNEALGDISNVDENGDLLQSDDRRRMYGLGNRLWHTDASFQDPPGRYSMLSARIIPPVDADTEFADTRAAYDALPASMKAKIEGLRVHHSIAHSRRTLGFEFSKEEEERLVGAVHPLARTIPRSNRRSLYVASHASKIMDWPVPEGRLLLHELIEHATQPEFVYRHAWRAGDLVIWDNRATMHRARPFDDTKYRRELRRVTTLDIPEPATATRESLTSPPGPERVSFANARAVTGRVTGPESAVVGEPIPPAPAVSPARRGRGLVRERCTRGRTHGRGRWAKKWARSCRSASLSPLSSSSIVPP